MMIGKKNLFKGILIVCVALLLVALFQTSSVLLFSGELWNCEDLITFPPFETCFGDTVFWCENPEWYSLCKLVCYDGDGGKKWLICNPLID